jgi:Mobilization protein NikA
MQAQDAATAGGTVAKKRRRSGSEKRKSQRVRTLRISDRQDAELISKARAAGVSVSGYIRRRCCTAQDVKPRKLIPVEVQEVMRLRGQLGRLGNNLNQIVRRENFNENPFADEYRQALAGVREAIAQCHGLLRDAHMRMG